MKRCAGKPDPNVIPMGNRIDFKGGEDPIEFLRALYRHAIEHLAERNSCYAPLPLTRFDGGNWIRFGQEISSIRGVPLHVTFYEIPDYPNPYYYVLVHRFNQRYGEGAAQRIFASF